jgi:hypothetical protein
MSIVRLTRTAGEPKDVSLWLGTQEIGASYDPESRSVSCVCDGCEAVWKEGVWKYRFRTFGAPALRINPEFLGRFRTFCETEVTRLALEWDAEEKRRADNLRTVYDAVDGKTVLILYEQEGTEIACSHGPVKACRKEDRWDYCLEPVWGSTAKTVIPLDMQWFDEFRSFCENKAVGLVEERRKQAAEPVPAKKRPGDAGLKNVLFEGEEVEVIYGPEDDQDILCLSDLYEARCSIDDWRYSVRPQKTRLFEVDIDRLVRFRDFCEKKVTGMVADWLVEEKGSC